MYFSDCKVWVSSKGTRHDQSHQIDDAMLDKRDDLFQDIEEDDKDCMCRKPAHIVYEKSTGHTGYFCDRIRRIDYVLVMTMNQEAEPDKNQFLLGLIALGLELEMNKGVTVEHEKLIFVKLHAPDIVLHKYAEPLGYKKYFKEAHLQHLICHHSLDQKLLEPEAEIGYMKIARQTYRGDTNLSNYERSMIVYFLLRNQPLDPQRNYLGLKKLLHERILLDAYALHDGPYFLCKGQEYTQLNVRQMVNHEWCGSGTALKYQPKHLIHEYYGTKIAFFFAFYEFYNKFLFLLALVSLGIYVSQQLPDTDPKVAKSLKEICTIDKMQMCPECNNVSLCPFLPNTKYCPQIQWSLLQDNDYTIYYSAIISIWAALFYIFWKRNEMYYMWLWEVKYRCVESAASIVRPEYQTNFNQYGWEDKDGRWSSRQKLHYRYLRYFAVGGPAIIIMIMACMIYYNYFILHLKWPGMYKVKDLQLTKVLMLTSQHKILIMLTALFYGTMFVLEIQLGHVLIKEMLVVENRRIQRSHERRQAVQMFSLACLSCFPLPFYFGWFKGAFYSHSIRNSPEVYYAHCTYSCLDVLYMVILILVTIRIVLWKALHFWPVGWQTDFTMYIEHLDRVPAWEREYSLAPISESQLIGYFNELVLQFAMVVFLSPWFTLLPVIAFIMNWYDLRYKAQLMVQYSRRASLYASDGIMHWNTIVKGIVVLAPFIHALTITKNLRKGIWVLRRLFNFNLLNMHTYTGSSKMKDDWRADSTFIPDKCYFFEYWHLYIENKRMDIFPYRWRNVTDQTTGLMTDVSVFYYRAFNGMIILGYFFLCMAILLLFMYMLPMEIWWVLRYMEIERHLKRVFLVSGIQIPSEGVRRETRHS